MGDGRVGAERDVLEAAGSALLDVHDRVQEQVRGSRRAFSAMSEGSPSGRVGTACGRAADAVDDLLQLLLDTALVLRTDALEQQDRFERAGGR